MRLVRSWPAAVPEHRAHVVDDCERLVMDGYDYTPLGDIDDDILLLEWDIAVGKEDLRAFAETAGGDPQNVSVAPYRLYAAPGGQLERKWAPHLNVHGGFWAHMWYVDGLRFEPVRTGDRHCHTFGFGMVYLPRKLVRGYLDAAQRYDKLRRFTDTSFSLWHYHNVRREVPICWEARPVHLHYDITAMV